MITKAGYFYIALVEKWGVSPAVASDILESDELSELIDADYIAKEKVKTLKMVTGKQKVYADTPIENIQKLAWLDVGYNQAVSEINQAVDNLIKDSSE